MKILPFSKTFEGRTVLDFPGMEVESGKIYAIIGANGSGKSTFAKVLAGILTADKRGNYLDGGSFGYMPQKNYAFRLSTKANILLNGSDAARAESLMDAIQIRHLENKRADRLSGGETARMALVRLMMKKYDLVVLDEPTAALDLACKQHIAEYLRHYKNAGGILLLTTHDVMELNLCDEWYIIRDGVLCPFQFDGDVSKLVENL